MGRKKSNSQFIGIVLLVVGVGLIIWGYQLSGGLGSKLSKALSGSLPDPVMYRYIGGAALIGLGIFFSRK